MAVPFIVCMTQIYLNFSAINYWKALQKARDNTLITIATGDDVLQVIEIGGKGDKATTSSMHNNNSYNIYNIFDNKTSEIK